MAGEIARPGRPRQRTVLALLAGGALLLAAVGGRARLHALSHRLRERAEEAPPPPTTGDLVMTVNTAITHPVSRFIYGINFATEEELVPRAVGPWYGAVPTDFTLNRFGGNRLSAYNWENNFSNAGSDYQYENDSFLNATTIPGEATRERTAATRSRHAAMLLTIPMLGYVARDNSQKQLEVTASTRPDRLKDHFKVSVASKRAPFTLAPDGSRDTVFQDEYVNWVKTAFPPRDSLTPIFFALDNEPDIWHSTHKEIRSDFNDDPTLPRLLTYQGFIDTTIEYARAIKRVMPNALVFGPGVATYTGLVTLGRYPNPDPAFPDWHRQPFYTVYLDQLRAAERTGGHRLLDVFDFHWYPAAGTPAGQITVDRLPQDDAMREARLQAPRSLWDPAFDEHSWVSQTAGGPIRLLPRLRDSIAAHYPGTKIGISEYYFGRAGDITGGIAQADVLGIFGREGVFAAAFWGSADPTLPEFGGSGSLAYAYALGAFTMYRNYDGDGGHFGDIGVAATTADSVHSSIYGSLDAAGHVVLVVINKQSTARDAVITIHAPSTFFLARMYTMRDGQPHPIRQPDPPMTPGAPLRVLLPALSVSTIVVGP